MKNLHSTRLPGKTAADDVNEISVQHIIGKAVSTKDSINTYLKGEITILELNARGIKFINTV